MVEKGFLPDFSEAVVEEVAKLKEAVLPKDVSDLRDLMWVSIDNEDSRDLDQLTYAEENRLYVAIADVTGTVKKGSAIDQHASHNTTSIYTPTKIFPMLPLELSNQITSLNEKSDRSSMVVEMEIGEDGKFTLLKIFPALVRNQAKLAYPGVGICLEQGLCLTHPIPSISGLRKQLELQDNLAIRIQKYRDQQGALQFAELELRPIVVNGIPVGIEEKSITRAHKLIENFMIAANVAVTTYLTEKKVPTIRRVVKTPKRWDRIVQLAGGLGEELPPKPDVKALRAFLLKQQKLNPLHFPDLSLSIIKLIGKGEYVLGLPGKEHLEHFDLAEMKYAHTTAPNRRYPDLLMQRILKSVLFNTQVPYTKEHLVQLASHCTEREDAATKLERRLIKCAAAMVLVKDIGKEFKAIVTGASPKGTWIRLLAPPIEGKLIKGYEGVDVGDFLSARLVHVDIRNGHIDFVKLN